MVPHGQFHQLPLTRRSFLAHPLPVPWSLQTQNYLLWYVYGPVEYFCSPYMWTMWGVSMEDRVHEELCWRDVKLWEKVKKEQ